MNAFIGKNLLCSDYFQFGIRGYPNSRSYGNASYQLDCSQPSFHFWARASNSFLLVLRKGYLCPLTFLRGGRSLNNQSVLKLEIRASFTSFYKHQPSRNSLALGLGIPACI